MLYLVMGHYDNGESWEDHYDKDTVVGVFETKELAEEEIECVIEEGRKGVDTRNEKIKKYNCPDCERLDSSSCTRCFSKFIKTGTGYVVFDNLDDLNQTRSLDYSVKEIELNQRIN